MIRLAVIHNVNAKNSVGAYIEKVLTKAGIPFESFWIEEADSIPRRFDLYFRIDHGDYKKDIPLDMQPAIFYAIDTHLKKPYKKIKKQIHHFDIVFCAHRDGMIDLKRQTSADAQWIPVAAFPEIHKEKDCDKRYDVAFVGRDARKFARGVRLDILKENYKNSFIGTAKFTEIGKIYASSKIGFNSSINNDINMRMFEIMASGCFLLTNKISEKSGWYSLFTRGKHFVDYKNNKEMLELIDYYLNHDEERIRIASAGHEEVMRNHTYYYRVQQMMNYIAFKFGGDFNSLRI